MATATVARPAQALRQRRDAPRPSLSKRLITMDTGSEPAGKKRKLNEPYVWDSAYILRKHKGKAPSLTVQLHPTHFKFEGQDGSFAYESPMRVVIQHIRKQTVPHEMLEELLQSNVPFYDGCLIVEVQNFRTKEGKDKSRHDSGVSDGTVRFSMHNYNPHVTPSPLAPFPKEAAAESSSEKNESSSSEMPAPEKPKGKEKEGPAITTVVLFPTELSIHHEMLLLAKTPASEVRNKKRGSTDTADPGSAQPATPQLSVPPTPLTQTSRGPLTESQKMCLEEGDYYSFQSDLLMTTEPPLLLDPVDTPQDAQKVLDMLQHPLHQEQPPLPKTRKRTTAEVAADDAQAAETERRMLIMDERIKPSGANAAANENQSTAASLGFSRFKTIEMVRQKYEETERVKKEDEARAMAEKKQAEEEQQRAQLAAQNNAQRINMMQQPQPPVNQANIQLMQQRRENMRRAQAAQMMNNQNHAHPQTNGMMQNQQQNFQHANQAQMQQQSSPIVRQPTPMNSSPMIPQGGFPVAQTSSQGPGSPPRPTSGAVQNPMARQISQQQRGSQNNTPNLPQGTPSMSQAVPNRQMTQTPRMPPGSPAAGMQQGTPTSASMHMPTPQMANQGQFTPEQAAMLQRQYQISQSQQNPNATAVSPQNMTPDQIQHIQHQNRIRQQQAAQRNAAIAAQQAVQNGQDPAVVMAQMKQQQQQQMMMRQQMMQQQQAQQRQQSGQMQGTPGQAGSPGPMMQQTPQMGHAHPQQQQQGNMQDPSQMTPQQQQAAQAQAQARATQLAQHRQNQQQVLQQQIRGLVQTYGSVSNIPQQVMQQLPGNAQQLIKQHQTQHQQQMMRSQQQMRQQQQTQQNGGEQVPAQQPNPHYMQQLRDNQARLAQMQSQQQQNGQGGGGGGGSGQPNMGGMSFGMNMGQGFNGQQGTGDLTQQFAAMQNALNRQNSSQGGGQGMQ